METTKKTARKTGNTASEGKIKAAYVDYVLTQGKTPVSVYKFCIDLGIKEEDFYQYFGSFEGLEKNLWKGFIEKTITLLKSDKSFAGFSAREKVLAFYYTLLEELKSNRSFVLFQLQQGTRPGLTPPFLREFKATFEAFMETVLNEGIVTGEIAKRPYLDSRYAKLFWFHMGFILLFWRDDDSPSFEKTDAAVEKSVNLAFDLAGKGAVDSVIDFGKFLYQNKVKR